MAELTDRIRGWFQGVPRPSGLYARQRAARSQLHGHIDEGLLEGFIRRSVTPEQHATVLAHLNKCHDCQEAVAVVLLSHDDPTAAAEIVLESEKRAKVGGLWWRSALRWTGVVFGIFAIGLLLYLLPAADSPDLHLANLLKDSKNSPPPVEDSASESDTVFSGWISSTFSSKDEKPAEEKRKKRSSRNTRQVASGWDTGPAPYHDKVQPTPGAIEVEIPPEAKVVSPAPDASTVPESPAKGAAPQTAAPRSVTRGRLVVTDEGELMRTLDDGATWKIITIKRGLAFNSLAVSGGNIWAAGDSGALYRSPDAADNWQQVIVKYRGIPLTDHIDRIRFADPQHGQFITESGDSWITVDGGNNWILSFRHKSAQ